MNFGGGYQSVDSYGGGYGGGYDAGMGGGGGGYMHGSSQGFASPGVNMSPSVGGKGKTRMSTVTPVTAAQIGSATEGGENFKIDDKEIGMVSLIGEIMEVNETNTTIVYMIDDRTGPWIKVQKWLEEQDPSDQQERSSCREGMYVKVIGNLKSFNKQRNITAFYVKPIEDFNELSHHMAEIMYINLAITKGIPVPEQFQQQAQQAQQATTNQWGTPMATSTQVGSGGYGGHGGGMSTSVYSGGRDSGLAPIQQQVLNTISSCGLDQGINIQELIKTMSQHGHNHQKVRTAVEFLCTEGHIYSTIDDDHFKSTDA